MKAEDLLQLFGALQQLEGYSEVVDRGGGVRQVVRLFFKYEPDVRLKIARNIVAVRRAMEPIEMAQQTLRRSCGLDAPLGDDATPEQRQAYESRSRAFDVANQELMQRDVEIVLVPLTQSDLNLRTNHAISGSVLAGLAPCLALTGG